MQTRERRTLGSLITWDSEECLAYDPFKVGMCCRVRMADHLIMMAKDFAEHFHDSWAMARIDNGWTCGSAYDEDEKKHPNLKQFNKLPERVSAATCFVPRLSKEAKKGGNKPA